MRIAIVALFATVILAACNGDFDPTPTPAPTATEPPAAATETPSPPPPSTPIATASPTPAPTPSPTPTPPPTATPPAEPSGDPAVAETLARGAAYFLYEARGGESLDEVAAATSSTTGATLRDLNELGEGLLAAAQPVAIPNEYADGQLIPLASLEAYLGISDAEPGLQLLRPSTDLIDGLLGRLALHRVTLVGPDSPEGAGYVLVFAQTDRSTLKGGVLDPDVRVSGLSFSIAGGSLATATGGAESRAFYRAGVRYVVEDLDRSGPTADQIAALLTE